MFPSRYYCVDCGAAEVYRSRPRSFLEKYVLPLLLHRAARCSNCFRRVYVSIFSQLLEREENTPELGFAPLHRSSAR
jgi:hypothetical protein